MLERPHNSNPREIPNRSDPGSTNPEKDPTPPQKEPGDSNPDKMCVFH